MSNHAKNLSRLSPGGFSVAEELSDLVSGPKEVAVPDFGVVVFESRHAPGFAGELKNNFAKFLLVIAGRARWESGGRPHLLGPNTLFHIAPGVVHRQTDLPNAPVTLYGIHYRPDVLSAELTEALGRSGMLPLNLASGHVNQTRQVRALFQEMVFEQNTRRLGWKMVLRSRLADLAVLTLRSTWRSAGDELPILERSHDSMARVASYATRLKSHFYRSETLDTAAHAAGLSRRRFTDLFRQVTGQPWRKYLQGLRLEHAHKLLSGTEKSVTAVAFECGFDDLSHFHHSFKVAYHCTPLDCREQARRQVEARPAARGSRRK